MATSSPIARDHLEGIGVVGLAQRLGRRPRELQAQEAAAGLQHPARLAQRRGDVGDVADAEADHIGVGAVRRAAAGAGRRRRPRRSPAPAAARGRPRSSRRCSRSPGCGRPRPPRRSWAPRASLASRRAMSPVPPAQSTMVSPGWGFSRAAVMSFHSRCTPRAHQVVHQVVAAAPRGRTRRAPGRGFSAGVDVLEAEGGARGRWRGHGAQA